MRRSPAYHGGDAGSSPVDPVKIFGLLDLNGVAFTIGFERAF